MKLTIDENFFISEMLPTDGPALIEHLQEKQIHDQTINIPHPYTQKNAEEWLNIVAEETKALGYSLNWAIRQKDGRLIGGIGFHGLDLRNPHRAEIGYWLAKPFWNQGLMTKAVKTATSFGFQELGFSRITANVFHFNTGSARVLEKAGYQLEGRLRKHYNKNGRIFDGFLFATINEKS